MMRPSHFLAAVAASLTPEPAAECRLAYGLERQFGRVCRRKGGASVCGMCLADLRPEEAARLTVREMILASGG